MRTLRADEQTISEFTRDQAPLIRGRVNIILLIGVLFVPFFGCVDFILYPEYFGQFMTYRLVASATCLLLCAVNLRRNLGYKSLYLGIAGYYVVGLAILLMILDTDGYGSPYYAGLNLVFLTFITVLTVRIQHLILHSGILYGVFVVSVYLFGQPNQTDLFLGNNMFVVSTIVILLVASYTNYQLRLREYLLRKESEKMRAQLERYSKALENTVAESEEKYRLVVENAGEAILVVMSESFKYANPKALDLFGYSEEEMLARKLTEFVHPDDRDVVLDLHRNMLKDGMPVSEYSFRVLDRNADLKWVEVRMAPITWEGKPAILDLMSDITERKHAEAALREAHSELERRVKERTAELVATQEELVRKERLAVLGKLTAVVSHEIRNPLGTIRASLFSVGERIRGKGLGVERALDRADRNVVRCDRIIEELLDFTRDRQPDLEPTKVDEWLQETLEEQTIPEEITLTLHLASNAEVSLDRERFRRCMLNVVSNACQAMVEKQKEGCADESGGKGNNLTIETRLAGGRVEIRVIDTGPGILPQEVEKAFQLLYSTKGFGVGLGLPIVKQIIEQHRGGIEIESTPGGGATVVLWLPTGKEEGS